MFNLITTSPSLSTQIWSIMPKRITYLARRKKRSETPVIDNN